MHPFYFVYFQNTKLLFPAASHPAGAYLAETGKSSGAGKRCGPRRVLNLHILTLERVELSPAAGPPRLSPHRPGYVDTVTCKLLTQEYKQDNTVIYVIV